MQVALGFKAHSGWAALVALGKSKDGFAVIDRRRIELIDDGELWAKQPYHAAEGLPPVEARKIVKNGIDSARRVAKRKLREILRNCGDGNFDVGACAVITPEPMPDWSTDEILSVHFRMHKAEGVLFPDALARAAEANGLNLLAIREKTLDDVVQESLARPIDSVMEEILLLGRSIGPPWRSDQKLATLAAMVALKQFSRTS